MDIEHYHPGHIRPNTVGKIGDESLHAYIACQHGIRRVCGHRFTTFLLTIFCHEVERRQSGGQIERRSFPVPMFLPTELAAIRSYATVQTYQPTDADFWDEVLCQIDFQTRLAMANYAELLEQQ